MEKNLSSLACSVDYDDFALADGTSTRRPFRPCCRRGDFLRAESPLTMRLRWCVTTGRSCPRRRGIASKFTSSYCSSSSCRCGGPGRAQCWWGRFSLAARMEGGGEGESGSPPLDSCGDGDFADNLLKLRQRVASVAALGVIGPTGMPRHGIARSKQLGDLSCIAPKS